METETAVVIFENRCLVLLKYDFCVLLFLVSKERERESGERERESTRPDPS